MYAIAFDLDTGCLKGSYPGDNYNNAYAEIARYLGTRGFSHRQGSLYYGNSEVTMVSAIVAVTKMGQQFPWLAGCVSDIRILQLVNNDDLKPALDVGFQMVRVPMPPKAKKAVKVLR